MSGLHSFSKELSNKKIKIGFSVVIAIFFIIVSNLRPGIMGQKLGSILILAVLYLVFVLLLLKPKISLIRIQSPFIFSYVAIVFYLIFQMTFIGLENPKGAISVLFMISLGYLPFLFGDAKAARTFAKYLVIICLLLGLSYILTFILASLKIYFYLFTINIPTHTGWVYELPIMFPFSPVYDAGAKVGSLLLPRAIGFMREPGLYQMVLIVAFWMVDIYDFKKALLIRTVLILSLIFTFSTAGYFLFLITVVVKIFSSSKKKAMIIFLGLPILASILYFLFTTESQFGLAQKFNNRSGLSRLEVTLKAIELITENPFMGIGFHNRINGMELGINFLGTTAQIGLIGVFVFLFPFIFTLLKIRKQGVAFISIWLCLLTTMLFSQPLYDKPITYLVLSFLILSVPNKTVHPMTSYVA
ncbi:MAG: hypothetical protein ACI93L_001099 [Cyclobacteriaceae bacterium]|jgi:hypothetical protein